MQLVQQGVEEAHILMKWRSGNASYDKCEKQISSSRSLGYLRSRKLTRKIEKPGTLREGTEKSCNTQRLKKG